MKTAIISASILLLYGASSARAQDPCANLQDYFFYGSSQTNTVTSFGAAGGSSMAGIATPAANCAWQITDVPSWITILSPTSGVGPSVVRYAVHTNGTAARTGEFRINSARRLFIDQAGQSCTFGLTPAAASVPAVGQNGQFGINASASNCVWTAFGGRNWLQPFPIAGSGSQNISYTIFPNFGASQRTGFINAASQNFAVTQAGATGTNNERFVGLMYYNFFGRIATQAEINFHVNNTLAAPATRADLVMAFFNSAEFNNAGRFIAGIYVGLLDRDAEFGGWLFQRNALATGVVDQHSLIQNFLNSQEYQFRFGSPSNEDYVRLLYRHVLLREATPNEVAFQASGLNSGANTRVQMAVSFLNSNEFRAGTGPRLTAFALFATLLSRDADFIETGNARNRLTSGTPVKTLVEEIVGAAEFNTQLN